MNKLKFVNELKYENLQLFELLFCAHSWNKLICLVLIQIPFRRNYLLYAYLYTYMVNTKSFSVSWMKQVRIEK